LLILDNYHTDTLFMRERVWGSVVIFRRQMGSTSKTFGKHCVRMFKVVAWNKSPWIL